MEREKAAARADKITSIRDQVGGFTDDLMRSYGAKLSLGGFGSPPQAAGGGGNILENLLAGLFKPAAGGGKGILPPILGL